MSLQHFFVKGKFLGSRTIPDYTMGLDGMRINHSYVLVCPKCQEIWARLMHDHPMADTQIERVQCPEHAIWPSDGTLSAQSPYPGYLREWQPDWPKAASCHDIYVLSTRALALEKECV